MQQIRRYRRKISGNYQTLLWAGLLAGASLMAFVMPQPPKSAPTNWVAIRQTFAQATQTDRVACYWYWINDHVSKEGISRDLEAMAKAGIGEAYVSSIYLPTQPLGNVPVLSEAWWACLEHAVREGKRVGVNIGLFNCPGWSQSGGPWVKPEQAMRYLTAAERVVDGGGRVRVLLPQPKPNFQDVAVLAFPEAAVRPMASYQPKLTMAGGDTLNLNALVDGDTTTTLVIPNRKGKGPLSLTLTLSQPLTARTLRLRPATGRPFRADVLVEALIDGVFKPQQTVVFQRTDARLSVGFDPVAEVVERMPGNLSQTYRFTFSNTMPVGLALAEIELSERSLLARYPEKQLARMSQSARPLWRDYSWPDQPDEGFLKPQQVLNLTRLLRPDGSLEWEAPPGRWVIQRIGATPTGVTNTPVVPAGQGLEIDKMNARHVADHFEQYVGKLLRRMPRSERSALTKVVADSYETGGQNWTDELDKAFRAEYGYDPLPWLPVLSGRIVETADLSNRFLWDLRRLVANRIAYEYVGTLRRKCEEVGLTLWLENYGHWGFPAEFLQYGGQSHQLGGEFWAEGVWDMECRAAISAAHTYGLNRVSAEAYTARLQSFRRYPASLKRQGDWAFSEGINHLVIHVYIHQAYEDRTPGMNAWFGLELNRKNTWFDEIKPWIDYQRRCMFLLQQGRPVADVAYYIGEQTPVMTGIQSPPLPPGYDFDFLNAEVLLNRLQVRKGQFVLPNGVSYRVLVLPPQTAMRPAVLAKLADLIKAGGVVVGPRPTHSPSLANYLQADIQVNQLADALWGASAPNPIEPVTYGLGKIYPPETNLQDLLTRLGVVPDVQWDGIEAYYPKHAMPDRSERIRPQTPIRWVHRRLPDGDIFFVTNQTDSTVSVAPIFRVANQQPEWWDAVTGATRPLPEFQASQQTTRVPLLLAPGQSGFVVFRRGAKPVATGTNFPVTKPIADLSSNWDVAFAPVLGNPSRSYTFATLSDWATHPDPFIQHFSGRAVYTKTFNSPTVLPGQRVQLVADSVRAIARVRLNEVEVGHLWTAPYTLDITKYLRPGLNRLEVEVVNSWHNRLKGDALLPASERKTWLSDTNTKLSERQTSGLLGRVWLETPLH